MHTMPAVHFVTFGSTPRYVSALTRIERQACESGYFDTVTAYTQDRVLELAAHSDFIATNPRGYGYWIWKALVILDQMSKVAADDIIVYADAGCSICTTPDARRVWPVWLGLIKQHSTHRICFHHSHMEEKWSKKDLSVLLKCSDNPSIMKSPQAWAGLQIMQNTPENQALVREWLSIMTRDNYHYVTDAPSRIPNSPSFSEHRHDQAVISLLMKLRGAMFLPAPYRTPIHPILCTQQRDS